MFGSEPKRENNNNRPQKNGAMLSRTNRALVGRGKL